MGALAGLIGLGRLAVRRSVGGGTSAAAWDAQAAAAAVAIVLIATDVLVLAPGWAPYALVGLLALTVLTGPRDGRRVPGDLLLVLLCCWGLAGSLYGRLVLGEWENALAFFLPVGVALAHLWRPLPLHESEHALRLTRGLLLAGLVYGVLAYVVLVRGWSILPVGDFKHERLYFVAMGVVAAVVLRERVIAAVLLLLAAAAFLSYPALTWVLVAVVTVAVIAATGRRFGPFALTVGCVFVATVAVGLGVTTGELRQAYFDGVGKGDNTATREVLLQTGVQRYLDSPLYGDAFTANIAVPSDVTGRYSRVPVHNDFFQLAISGGALGGGLFLLWCSVTLIAGIRLVRRLRGAERAAHADLALVVLVGVATMLATAVFNPVLINTRTSLLLGLLCAVLASVHLATSSAPTPAAAVR